MKQYLNGGKGALSLFLALAMLLSLSPAALAERVLEDAEPETAQVEPVAPADREDEIETLAEAQDPLTAESLSGVFTGSGTQDDPYQIASEDDLRTLAGKVNGNYVGSSGSNLSGVYFLQTGDITFGGDSAYAGVIWQSIGEATGYYFGGNYDGGGHFIDFGSIESTGGTYSCGLVGCMSGGSIKNVTVKGSFTSTGSSMVAAGGIVSYALNGAEIENCVNEMNISGKGFIGGIAGKASGGTNVISGCTNTGTITAISSYYGGLGGIIGEAESGTLEVTGCRNTGTIDYGSYTTYCAGGIVGWTKIATTISTCGNEGTVTGTGASTSYGGGGIVGYVYGVTTIDSCYNRGTITGKLQMGGIVGYVNKADSAVKNCFNLGNVSYTGASAAGVGGIAGKCTVACVFTSCYNGGTITSTYSGSYSYCGAITGYGYKTYKNNDYYVSCYYLESTADCGVAYPNSADDPTASFAEYNEALVADLGSAYVADKNGVLDEPSMKPILAWMDPNASFGALFTITDSYTGKTLDKSGCTIRVFDGEGTEVVDQSSLPNGTYTYTVEKPNYDKASGSFTVNKGNASVSVSLSPTAYPYTLTVTPADAAVTLTNSDDNVGTVEPQSASGGVYTYALYKCYGTYTWTVKCYGYSDGKLTLAADAVAAGSGTVELTALDRVAVSFTVTDRNTEAAISDAEISVVSTDFGQTMTADSYGEYSLVNGSYSYTVRRSGYGTVHGSFTVSGGAVNIAVPMGEPDKWDGESIDTSWYDPEASSYYISTPAELAGFAAITNGTADGISRDGFEGKTVYVTCDLDLDGQEWTPISNATASADASESNSFCGTFDAQGHSIKNVQITGSSSGAFNRGFFSCLYGATVKNLVLTINVSNVGYLYGGGVAASANSSTIENITTYGSFAIASTSGKYVYGGIVGRATATTITGCTNNIDFSDPSQKSYQIGGIIGYCKGGTVTDCVNNGDISASYTLGGIVGVTYTNASTISRCVNTGHISSSAGSSSTYYGSGGIVGCARNDGDTISSCANFGMIDGATTSTGGILGCAYTATVTVENCYNAGTVSTTYASGYAGGIVGQAKYTNSSGIAYKIMNCYNRGSVSSAKGSGQILGYGGTSYLTADYLTNNYYLDNENGESTQPVGNGSDYSELCTAFQTADDYTELIAKLGEGYCADLAGSEAINDGYPILTWQDPNATFAVTFEVGLDNSRNDNGHITITVRDAEDNVMSPVSEDGAVYRLPNGDYTYTVEKQGYACTDSSDSGTFTVRQAGKTITVNLTAEKYQWRFTVSPDDADFQLTDSDGTVLIPDSSNELDLNRIYIYTLYNGVYTYTASKLGYVKAPGEDDDNDSENNGESDINALAVRDTINVEYAGGKTKIELVEDTANLGSVTFTVTTYDGEDATPAITIIAQDGDYAGQVVFTGSEVNALTLPAGAYSYTVKATGYANASGTFTLTAAEPLILSVELPKRTGWDGESIDTDWYTVDPSATEFYIYTEDELAGLAAITNGTANGIDKDSFSGKTVNLRASMDLGDHAWTPIGANTGAFEGVFNGNGCSVTISEGNFKATGASYFGLFGYVKGTGSSHAQIKNLIVYGNVTVNSTNMINYVGGVAGYATYTDFTNVSNRMNITVTVTTTGTATLDLGGICGWSVFNNYSCCSNTGNIKGTVDGVGNAICYVGGLAGYTTQSSSYNVYSISNCYNNGNITAEGGTTNYGGGLVGNGSSGSYQSMTNCYNSGTVNTGHPLLGNGSYNSSGTKNNYYLDTTLGEDVTSTGASKTEEELSAPEMVETLGENYKASKKYPVLYWEAAPYAIQVNTQPNKTEYNDMEAFEDAGLSLLVLYSESDTTGDVIYSGWQILDGDSLDATRTYVTVSYMGLTCQVPITVTQAIHYITDEDLTFTIAPPAVGETPQTTIELTDEQSKKIVSATVTWYADGVEMGEGETFAANTYYRAFVTLEARYEDGNVYYNFDSACKPDIEEYYELLYRASSNSGRTLTFTLTYALSDTYSDSASHSYYAGDSRVAGDYSQYLDDTLTVTVAGESRTLTVAEIEKYALAGGMEATYSYQTLNSRENYLLSGVPLYRLLLEQFPALANASDESAVSIGELDLTLGELRKSGCSYDENGALLESGLPYLLAFGVNGKPYTSARGPLYLAAPAFTAGNENSSRFAANVSSITVDLVTATTFNATFVIVDTHEETVEDAVVTITDSYGNVVYSGGAGTVTLNQGETYSYEVSAPGYAAKSGTVSSAGEITVKLLKPWSGNYKEPAYDGETNTYTISTVEELMWYDYQATRVSTAQSEAMMGANIELMADVDLTGTEDAWIPMGALTSGNKLYFYTVTDRYGDDFIYYGGGEYTGTFNGNGHTISNLNLDWENFYVLEDLVGSPVAYIYRLDRIGGLFGATTHATITDLGVTGSVTVLDRPADTSADWFQLGGLVGFAQDTAITGCYTDVTLNYTVAKEGDVIDGYTSAGYPEVCDLYIGGIAGSMSGLGGTRARIENCYTTGSIYGEGVRSIRAGGIAGATRSGVVNISKCYASGSIEAAPSYFAEVSYLPSYVGGIVGAVNVIDTGSAVNVSYCFALDPSLTISYADGQALEYTHANRVIGDEDFASKNGNAQYNFGLEGMIINGAAYTQTEDEQSYRSASGRSVTVERAYQEQTYKNFKWNEEEEPVWAFSGSSYPTLAWQGLTQEGNDPDEPIPSDPGEGNDPDEPIPSDPDEDPTDTTPIIDKDPGADGTDGGDDANDSSENTIVWPDPDCDGEGNCPSGSFTDFAPTQWYHEHVDFVVTNGIFNGVSTTRFAPDASMTRAMFATVIARVENLLGRDTAGCADPFTDVAPGAWYEEGVSWAAENGVVLGISSNCFAPNLEITREQMVTMLYRYAGHLGMDVSTAGDSLPFADSASVSGYAGAAVQWAYENGILTGKNGNCIDPQGTATRAEVAAVLYRFLSLAAETEE